MSIYNQGNPDAEPIYPPGTLYEFYHSSPAEIALRNAKPGPGAEPFKMRYFKASPITAYYPIGETPLAQKAFPDLQYIGSGRWEETTIMENPL